MRAQALSKRIHYGKFVAEAKFRARPQEYARLIRQRDSDALMALLTDEAVEAKVHPLGIAESPLTRGIWDGFDFKRHVARGHYLLYMI